MNKMYRITVNPDYLQYAHEIIVATDLSPVKVEEIQPSPEEVKDAEMWCWWVVDEWDPDETLKMTRDEAYSAFREIIAEDKEDDPDHPREVPGLVDFEMFWNAILKVKDEIRDEREFRRQQKESATKEMEKSERKLIRRMLQEEFGEEFEADAFVLDAMVAMAVSREIAKGNLDKIIEGGCEESLLSESIAKTAIMAVVADMIRG